jgi:tellurite resistance protein TerC
MNIPFIIGFLVFVAAMLALDLGVFNRKEHTISIKEALAWTAVWVSLALAFNVCIYFFWDWMAPASNHTYPRDAALAFLTGYVIEESLSMDNVFVFALIFSYFRVPSQFQHRVLFWGVIGAIVMRGVMIVIGASLVQRFEWILYIFGAFLLFTGIKLAVHRDVGPHPERNPIVRIARKVLPISSDYDGKHFLTRQNGKRMATPLLLVLIVVETSDLMFATDSLPAIFAITSDPTIVFTSNIFAIMGLRSLYFVLAGMIERFRYLKTGLAIVLTFVGVKMLIVDFIHIPTLASLGFIAIALGSSIAVSLISTAPTVSASDNK